MGLSDLVYPASNWDQTTNYRPCAKVISPQSVSERKGSSAESLRPRTGVPIPGQQLKVTLDKSPPPFLWLWAVSWWGQYQLPNGCMLIVTNIAHSSGSVKNPSTGVWSDDTAVKNTSWALVKTGAWIPAAIYGARCSTKASSVSFVGPVHT